MRRKSENQTIILSGISGSGKTTTHLHLLKEILYLSTHTRKEEKIHKQILAVYTIMKSFGTAMSSSCLAQFQTLRFNARGGIIGCDMSVFLLDKYRVSSRQCTQQFTIFYQLLAGTTTDEKCALHITHSNFYYLKHLGQRDIEQDTIGFEDVKAALKLCGFKTKTVAQMCQLLAAILHLGNVQFVDGNKHHFTGDDILFHPSSSSGICRIKNKETLTLVAASLGIATSKLETSLIHKLKLIGNEFCTAFLTVDTASQQRDALAHTLYAALIRWITNTLNQRLNKDELDIMQTISVLDSMGTQSMINQRASGFYHFCVNYTLEQLLSYTFFDLTMKAESAANIPYVQDQIWPSTLPVVKQPSNSLSLFHGKNNDGLISLINKDAMRFQTYALDATDSNLLSVLLQKKKSYRNSDYETLLEPSMPSYSFAIHHFNTINVNYSIDGFLESNLDYVSPDFVHMFRYNCTNTFVHEIFETAGWLTEKHPRDEKTVIKAQLPIWYHNSNRLGPVLDHVVQGVEELKDRIDTTRVTEIIHVLPSSEGNVFDPEFVKRQLEMYHLVELAQRISQFEAPYGYNQETFLNRYRPLMDAYVDEETVVEGDESRRIGVWIDIMKWTVKDIQLGQNNVWLSFELWQRLEREIRTIEKEERIRERERQRVIEYEKEILLRAKEEEEEEVKTMTWRSDISHDDDRTEIDTQAPDLSGKKSEWEDDEDGRGLAEGYGPNLDMSQMMEDYTVHQIEEQIEEVSITSTRQWWSRFVLLMTWWIPSFTLKYLGKMTRQDVQMAWREKVTLCMLIFASSGGIIFFIVGFRQIICPNTKYLYSAENVGVHQMMTDYWISIRGKVYDLTKFVATDHGTMSHMTSKYNLDPLAGRDLSYTFPPPLTIACPGLVKDTSITITPNQTIVLGPFIHFSGPQQSEKALTRLRDPDWLTNTFEPRMNNYKKGDLVISLKRMKEDYASWGRLIASIDERVYDLTDYMATARRYPASSNGEPNYHYLHPSIEAIFTNFGGKDITSEWNNAILDALTRSRNKACLDNVFYIGRLDYRESLRCTFINYLLLSFAIIMSVVILVKFLAALQFGSSPTPEDHDKFVICQVPCYTEDEESLRKTINSLTAMTYDDKHKLLFLIADGMIIGSGNDRPTPRILLDILGHDEMDDPEPLMFKSIGEGSKQLNYGKVYSGVYQNEGHVVPYIVVVKVGKSTERAKPGNRGKRDSQIICMNFLNKVHFDSEMSPLELSIYHHIKYIIGIDPHLYEYILMVDSDTEVYPDALNRLISCMLHDSRIIGLCGETELGNEDRSWTTMIQVYEYYISHHLVKSFESLFGSVTCLPGCFCMYRIRTASKHQPLIVSPNVIRAYSDNQVDTLHKKNLLHLGEDRYLTTLMMKNFPQYKMVFTPYAKCKTVAPDQWGILLSQRRRWINSTIHNLLELILLQELCGFCCISMRFVVMIDLIGTISLPSSVIYLIYLIYEVISGAGPIPTIALGMLAGAYGLQSLIFILKRQWQHIGWMIIYIFAIPIFSFFIPLYSFWHFDDFSWGNTRVVVGDNKKKQIIVTDDEKFDEKMIPLKKWAIYEEEMWVNKSNSVVTSYLSVLPDDQHTLDSDNPIDKSNSVKSELLPPLIPNFSDEQFNIDLSTVLGSSSPIRKIADNIDMKDSTIKTTTESRTVIIPEDDELEREIYKILINSNLMTLTKKQVRDQLSALFGVDLTIKRGIINTIINRLIEQSKI
ncbi:chitin synthase-domain-containing protein [Cokeromyces recurvatus]|uniref:chitin synthase-domain-containing protein n=1 Tax=Cokeromyces recurvatus TaxID=90255 RepID=UPI00222059C4|nr:chitin synthase-domain-containing protein [Cokeromyces recurvatus]KAI7907878.1 chitin synthase-domain-containing protein [Cokeromyces recurvatus]